MASQLFDKAKELAGNAASAVWDMVAPIANAVGNVVDTATGFLTNTPVPATPAPNPNIRPATPNVATPKPVQAPDTDVPVVPTDPADIAWNKKQAEFDAANPVGTEIAKINYNPQPATAAPTPVPTATATPVKTEPVNVDARTAEINANLAEGLKNDAGIQKAVQSGDLATFRTRYGYDTADQNKKSLLDSFFQSHQPTGNEDYYGMMRSGQRIANPSVLRSPQYKEAVARFNQFKKFANYDVNALASALKSGALLAGTKIYDDLNNDPNTKMKLDQAKVFNSASGKGTDYDAVGKNTANEIFKENANTAKMFDDGVISAEEYKAVLETPEITAQRNDLQADKIKYDTLKAQYDNIETDVETEMKGKDVTSSFRNALIADRRKGMYKDLQIATDTYNTKLGTLADMTKQQAGLFETNLGLYKERKQQENAKSMIDYQMAYQNPDINSENPAIASIAANKLVNSALEFAQTNGVPVQRNSAKILAEAKAYAQTNGVSLAQALQTTFTDPLHAKPEFVNAMTAIQNKNAPASKASTPEWKQDANTGKWYDANSSTRPDMQGTETGGKMQFSPGSTDFASLASKYPNVAAFKNNNPAGITWNANFDDPKPGSTAQRLIDAGISFSKGTARPAKEGGNYVTFGSIEDGMAAQRIMMEGTYGNGTVGNMLASWVGTSEGPAYAKQVATAAGIDTNSKVSDLSKDQLDALQIAKLSKESPGLLRELTNAGIVDNGKINFSTGKTYSPEELANAEWVTEGARSFAESAMRGGLTVAGKPNAPKEYTATQRVLFDKILAWKDDADDKKKMKQQGLTDEDVNAYAASILPVEELSDKKFTQYNTTLNRFSGNKDVAAFESGMSSYGDLISSLKSSNGPGDVAAIFQFMKTLDPTSTVRETEFELAAKSAGVWEQFKNIPANKLEGTIMNDEQRKAFGKLALKFVENKAKAYDRNYEYMKKIFKEQRIPDSYLPPKSSDYIKQYSGEEIQTASGTTYNLNDF